MDSITHIVLGACAGEAMLGKKIGKKAMLMGAIAQSFPDIDFVASFFLDTADDLMAHRGFTHSFLFILLVSPALGLLSRKTVMPRIPLGSWTTFFLVEMIIHLLLDGFNNYGVGWFVPFSDRRISFNTVYVADPLITIFPLIATIILLITRSKTTNRRKWWLGAFILSGSYLALCVTNKLLIDGQAKKALVIQNIPYKKYFSTPAPLQSFLWMIVAGDTAGYHVGFRSVLDAGEKINFNYFPANEHLLDSLPQRDDVTNLKRFSQGFYTVEQWGDTLVFNDLRFGQIIGWHDPKQRFVFHYFLQDPANNELIVQRGRFARWDAEVIRSFFKRILGRE